MTYEIYRYIFYGGAVLALIMLAVSVFLFIFLKIPTVIGDLTGANARKAIENIRNQNESSGDKVYKTSAVNRARGKLTDKISPSGNLITHISEPLTGAMATEKIGTQKLAENPAAETVVLSETGAETVVLSDVSAETAVLSDVSVAPFAPVPEPEPVGFVIEYEVTLIHTEEIID
jgi:hypothetical protein